MKTLQQLLDELEAGFPDAQWEIIGDDKSAALYLSVRRENFGKRVLYLCGGDGCRYVESKRPVGELNFLIRFSLLIKKYGWHAMPAVKFDLDVVPTKNIIRHFESYEEKILFISLKPTGTLLVRRTFSTSPLTLGGAGLATLKMRSYWEVDDFINTLGVDSTFNFKKSRLDLSLKLSSSDKIMQTNLAIAITGKSVTASTTFPPIDVVQKGWRLEGQVGFEITVTEEDIPKAPPPVVPADNRSKLWIMHPKVSLAMLAGEASILYQLSYHSKKTAAIAMLGAGGFSLSRLGAASAAAEAGGGFSASELLLGLLPL